MKARAASSTRTSRCARLLQYASIITGALRVATLFWPTKITTKLAQCCCCGYVTKEVVIGWFFGSKGILWLRNNESVLGMCRRLCLQSVKGTESDRQFELACTLFSRDDKRANAAAHYEIAARYGHCTAQFILGCIYENGTGVERSYAEAVRWLTMAAGQGHAGAQVHLRNIREKKLWDGVPPPKRPPLLVPTLERLPAAELLQSAIEIIQVAQDNEAMQGLDPCVNCGGEVCHKLRVVCAKCKTVAYCNCKKDGRQLGCKRQTLLVRNG